MADTFSKPNFFRRRLILGSTVGGALLFFIIGIIFWGGFNTAMEQTNTLEFCIGCHEMEENVYQEYIPSIHYSNRTGVRAACSDCHVPDPWIHKTIRKIQASQEVYHKLMGTVDTPEKFDAHRLTMAKRVWNAMKSTDSRECRNCHNFESMNPKFQQPRAREQHLNAFKVGQTCIDCHKGIAHKPVRDQLSEEELEVLEAPNPDYIREVPAMYLAGLQEVEAVDAEQAAQEKAAKEKAREKKIAAQNEEQARIEKAVADALAAYKSGGKGAAAAAGAAAPAAVKPAQGFGVDWRNSPERKITLFYPGQTSMEWTLVGKYHGGARPFRAGDRCTTCHDKETADMGKKMVTGAKAEPTPIEGKRAAIPVTVQAAHDSENLYLRFQWEDTEHVPVSFVDGGKMDPKNQVKLAVMFATDEVEYASQAGCWGTCHEDLRTMPGHPENPAAAGLALDVSQGVTKYIKESRTEVEEKGRRGAVLGGWDKLKEGGAVQSELAAGHFMDIMRWNSSGAAEDGHILDQRIMQGGQGVEFSADNKDGVWTLVMKRKLVSDKPGDIALEPGKVYNFGFAIHDDYSNARFHHVSLGYKLALDNPEAEVNAVKAEVKAPVAAATSAAKSAAAASSAATVDGGVDWTKAGERNITLFYPGQTSMEWTLVGKYHGGARPFRAGDRCTTCHDKETADMGKKMVTGAKAEPTPIEGKRAAIPVTVQSTHDEQNLYLRFQWEDTEHVPVSFVDGGKMDPKNQVKLAVMFATDEVEYASQAGCWGTCHEDLRTMPGHPENPAAAGLALDVSQGVTKYIKESRTEVEEKGRRGAVLGGWDKLKEGGAVQSELAAGHFMDIMRWNSSGAAEDGHILDQRIMQGGQGVEFSADNKGGVWTLVMKRKLVSDKPGDIALEPGKVYNFGFAIHDDYSNARFHHVSLGYKLGFDSDDMEINSIKQ